MNIKRLLRSAKRQTSYQVPRIDLCGVGLEGAILPLT